MAVLAACGRTRVLLLTEQRGKPALRRGHLSKDLEGERPEAMASTRRRKEHRAAEGAAPGREHRRVCVWGWVCKPCAEAPGATLWLSLTHAVTSALL